MSSPRFLSAGQIDGDDHQGEVGDQHGEAITRVDPRPEAAGRRGSTPGRSPASAEAPAPRARAQPASPGIEIAEQGTDRGHAEHATAVNRMHAPAPVEARPRAATKPEARGHPARRQADQRPRPAGRV